MCPAESVPLPLRPGSILHRFLSTEVQLYSEVRVRTEELNASLWWAFQIYIKYCFHVAYGKKTGGNN